MEQNRTQIFILGNPHGEENQQKFLYIDFNQVQCKTQRIRLDSFLSSRWTISSLSSATACTNEGDTSHIYTNQLRGLITQLG